MLALTSSPVVHALVFFYFLIAPVYARHSAANISYSPFSTFPYQQSTENGLTHSHLFRLTVALGAACLIYSARALGRAVCVSPIADVGSASCVDPDRLWLAFVGSLC